MRQLLIIFFLAFAAKQTTAQNIEITGTWTRSDDKIRHLSFTAEQNIKMVTEGGNEYIYYHTGNNTYQMKWTTGTFGTVYRWTMEVINADTIRNVYENKDNTANVVATYHRITL